MRTTNEIDNLRIGVIGAGYVGLTTAVCFSSLGYQVLCSDSNAELVGELASGRTRIFEEGLQSLLSEAIENGGLAFVSDNSLAAQNSDIIFICVPTPMGENGSANLDFVNQVINELVLCRTDAILVIRSTVPIGTCGSLCDELEIHGINLVFVPEFLREGTAITDFLNPSRIVIGSRKAEAAQVVAKLFKLLNVEILNVNLETAETIKYAANAFLAMKVSFINEIARTCERLGGAIEEVSYGIGMDPRIGSSFLRPGPGWGGSCFPKDLTALISKAEDEGLELPLIKAIVESNELQIAHFASRVAQCCSQAQSQTVSVLGLSFKAGTNDTRDSPSLRIVRSLLRNQFQVTVYDPIVRKHELGDLAEHVIFAATPAEAIVRSNVTAVLTDWPEFANLDPRDLPQSSALRFVLDARGVIDPRIWEEAGFKVLRLGSKSFVSMTVGPSR